MEGIYLGVEEIICHCGDGIITGWDCTLINSNVLLFTRWGVIW